MKSLGLVYLPLRAVLALTFLALLYFQVLALPGTFAYEARQSADFDRERWIALAIAVTVLFCVQVVIVCTWQLLTMVKRGSIFTEDAFRWVDLILGAIAVAWLLLAGVLLYVGAIADDPGLPVLLTLLLLVGASIGLLVVVLRALLRQATELHSDLEMVI